VDCSFCVYYTERGECVLHGQISAERRGAWCDEFVERSFRLAPSSGCCGISGLPLPDPVKESKTAD